MTLCRPYVCDLSDNLNGGYVHNQQTAMLVFIKYYKCWANQLIFSVSKETWVFCFVHRIVQWLDEIIQGAGLL